MTDTSRKLLIGTHNVGKAVEIASILSGANFTFLNLRDVGLMTAIAEVGSTYEENAILKAAAYARESGLLTWLMIQGLKLMLSTARQA